MTTPTAKQQALLEELRRYQEEHHGCPPSLAQLAEIVGIARQGVRRQLLRLVELGLVVRVGEGQAARYVARRDESLQCSRNGRSDPRR